MSIFPSAISRSPSSPDLRRRCIFGRNYIYNPSANRRNHYPVWPADAKAKEKRGRQRGKINFSRPSFYHVCMYFGPCNCSCARMLFYQIIVPGLIQLPKFYWYDDIFYKSDFDNENKRYLKVRYHEEKKSFIRKIICLKFHNI